MRSAPRAAQPESARPDSARRLDSFELPVAQLSGLPRTDRQAR